MREEIIAKINQLNDSRLENSRMISRAVALADADNAHMIQQFINETLLLLSSLDELHSKELKARDAEISSLRSAHLEEIKALKDTFYDEKEEMMAMLRDKSLECERHKVLAEAARGELQQAKSERASMSILRNGRRCYQNPAAVIAAEIERIYNEPSAEANDKQQP